MYQAPTLGHPYGTQQIREGLQAKENVVYTNNGNRVLPVETLLKRVLPILPKVGVSRVAEIGQLATYAYPVIQSTRPNSHFHYTTGLNSGAQGKGLSRSQAIASCVMESIESYCSEGKNVHLVRGSYDWLKKQHVVMNPLGLAHPDHAPGNDEPLMWSPAYSISLDCEVLVPAEAVYFPFYPRAYGTRGYFHSGTNGLASGATVLEAVTHAIYELIERSYLTLFKAGLAETEALFEQDYRKFDLLDFHRKTNGEYQLQLMSHRLPWAKRDLPVIRCLLVGYQGKKEGTGCAGDVETAIGRAISEAMQSLSTGISGSREDSWIKAKKPPETVTKAPADPRPAYPTERTLRLKDLKRKVEDRHFKDLRSEFRFLREWLKEMGCPEIFVANLTRAGIDVPVVKVLIPGMPQTIFTSNSDPDELTRRMYGVRSDQS